MDYLWQFGDGTTSTEQNPSHIYIRKGLYSVKLTVTNAYGSSSETKENYIAIGIAPRADFTGQPTIGNTPLAVEFTDRSTGYPTSWNWNFGDGKGSSDQNPVHTYWSSGDYTVTLTSANEYGTSDATKTYFIQVIPALKSRFIADPKEGKAPLVVKFTDVSTGNPESRIWEFGDGSTSTQPNPVHTYSSPGAFQVNLTVIRGYNTDRHNSDYHRWRSAFYRFRCGHHNGQCQYLRFTLPTKRLIHQPHGHGISVTVSLQPIKIPLMLIW